jgi:hypothetical protein
MKKLGLALLVLAIAMPVIAQQNTQQNPIDLILKSKDTTLTFDANSAQPTKQEIEKILTAAMKAPGGRNMQRYWYTAITDFSTQKELALTPEMKPTKGTVLFILSGLTKNGSDIDVGITCGYFVLAAETMGYGTQIFGQPPTILAQRPADFAKYGIPEGYTPKEFILVGKSDTVDATSAATTGERKANWSFLTK